MSNEKKDSQDLSPADLPGAVHQSDTKLNLRLLPPEKQRLPARGKMTRYEEHQRRTEIEKLRMRGLGVKAIAETLRRQKYPALTEARVRRELEAVHDENLKRVVDFDRRDFVGQVMRDFDESRSRAESEYLGAEKGSPERIRALRLLVDIDKTKLDAFLDVGLLPRAAQKIEHELPPEPPASRLLTDAVKDEIILALVKKTFTTELLGPIPDDDVVDAEIIPGVPLEREDE